jgi:ferredoxin-type protein NapH
MLPLSFRRLLQLSSTVFSNSYLASAVTRSVNTNGMKGLCIPFRNCYACPGALFSCPVGAIQHFSAIHSFPFYILAFIGLVGITIGRMACGWVCPFGFLQDLMYKINSPKFKIPYMLTYMKYLILVALVLVLPYVTGICWFSQICPAGTLTAGLPWAVWNPTNPVTGQPVLPFGPGILFYLSLAILIAFLAWFVLSKRPFCRVACPLGSMLSLFNGISMIRLETHRCDGCNTCKSNCPMDLNVYLDLNSKDCIRCLQCTQCDNVRVITPFSPRSEKVLAGKRKL